MEQLNGNPINYSLHRVLLKSFSSCPQTIYNKFEFTKEKDICVFLDGKVLSPCHFVENAFLSASLHWPSGISVGKGATW